MTSTILSDQQGDQALEPVGRSGSDARPGSAASAWAAAALSAVVVAGLYTVLFLRNHRYYYVDDAITGELPNRLDIGRVLLSGEFPWLSTEFVNAGAHAMEYSHGIFNPLLLAMSVVLTWTEDSALGAFLFILVHAVLLTLAGSWLARVIGLSPAWSVAFAVSLGFQPHTVLWDAAAWHEGLTSFAWFVFTVAAALAASLHGRRRHGWLVLLGTYGCLTSGWPLAIPVLGLFAAVLLVARLVAREPLRQTVWLAAWFAGGLACSMVAIYPLLTSGELSSRSSSISNDANFLVVSLEALLQFANPAYYGFFNNFGGYGLQRLPHFYVAWFALPLLVFWRAGSLPRRWRLVAQVALAMLAVSVLGAIGPERLLVFRFPTRFLQYAGFFLLLLVGLLVAHGRFSFTRTRVAVLLGASALLALNTLQADPSGLRRAVFVSVVVGAAAVGAWWLRLPGDGQSRSLLPETRSAAAVALGTVAVLLGLALAHPAGRGIDWGFPHERDTVQALSREDYTLYYGQFIPVEAYGEFRPSMIGVTVGDRQVNGYTSLGNRLFQQHFPMDDRGDFEPGDAAAFTRTDPGTGLQMLELLRVDQVIAVLGPMDDEVRGALGGRWQPGDRRTHTATYLHTPYTLPGLLSYASPGLAVQEGADPTCRRRQSRECVAVQNATDAPGRLVFARLWFPGYRAHLDGQALPVERYSDALVSVVVPPGREGEVVLSYRSPGFLEFTGLALAVLLALAVASVRYGRPVATPPAPTAAAGSST